MANVHRQFLWIPVIQEKNFVARGFGARQQEALVVSVPLLLRSSISESAHETQNFSLELRKQKKEAMNTWHKQFFYCLHITPKRVY